MAENEIDWTPVLERVGAFIKAEAIKKCPVDEGELRRSIDFRIEGNDTVVLFANAPTAEDMEFGKPPEPLSEGEKAEVDAWAVRHGLNNGKSIIKYLEKEGIKVGTPTQPLHINSLGRNSYRPYLRPAVYMNIDKIRDIIKKG